MQMIEWENENKYAELNGKNNKSKLEKSIQKDDWQYTYISTARQVVRMARLTDFCAILWELFVTTDTQLSGMCSEAYKKAFGAHHGYMIQGAAYIAIKTVPNREWLHEELKLTNPKETIS